MNPAKLNTITLKPIECQHFKTCAGCCSTHLAEQPAVWSEILKEFEAVDPLLYEGAYVHWRCRAKLAVRGTAQNPVIGLFKRHSHEVIPIPFCQVHHPRINQAVQFIRDWMIRHALRPYDEKNHRGDLRYVQCVIERSTSKIQASFVLNMDKMDSKEYETWKRALLKLPEETDMQFWHSLWINFNSKKTNTIFGEKWQRVWGEEFLWEKLGLVEVCFQPANFAQANLDLFEKLLGRIFEWIPEKAHVVEYYAGVGIIGLSVASKSSSVKCIEINPHSEICFNLAAAKLSEDVRKRVFFFSNATENALDLMQDANTVIVDPPRKGLSDQCINSFDQTSANQIIYVSCNWESFKRDYEKLCRQGWQIAHLEGYALFPGSNHVELLACLRKT
ncbi:MAG: class I SAM-dependent RNA methyltransferase [Candidatus Protochlamydia sp.]|nr:class I SAM-dependent RNA methyltransferase [Candidatus Protochlamydia sp.]